MDLEGAALIWLLGLAFFPLIAVMKRRSGRRVGLLLLATWLGGSAVFGIFALKQRASVVREKEVEHRPIQDPKEGFVTSQTCRSCHPGEYHSWHSSYHRRMTQVASTESVIGNFDNHSVTLEGRDYRLTRDGDEFWVELDDLDHDDKFTPPPRVRRRIELTTGSHHMQIYWLASGVSRKLDMMPILWLKEAKRWVPRRSVFLMPHSEELSYERGRWNRTCIICHTTGERPGLHTDRNMDSRVTEFGIACEACHGPSEEHVRRHQFPNQRYTGRLDGEDDPSVANPLEFSSELSSQACGQCHAVLEQADVLSYEHWLKEGKLFTPGSRLSDTLTTIEVGKPTRTKEEDKLGWFWNDGKVRVSGREYSGMIESPCYKHGIGERRLGCFSCHELHPDSNARDLTEWADDQLKPGMRSNAACLQCHREYEGRLVEHTKHAVDSSGSLCLNCHMPYTSYGLLTAIRSHSISSPSVTESLETGRPNACNQCHLDESLGWAAKALSDWHGQEEPQLSGEQDSVAASLLWAMKGDAGQRALMAWSMGWKPARETSGEDWMGRSLAELLDDPYAAVRYIAGRSLKRLPGYGGFEFDYVAGGEQLAQAKARALGIWTAAAKERAGRGDRPALLLNAEGLADEAQFRELLKKRDNRPVFLRE